MFSGTIQESLFLHDLEVTFVVGGVDNYNWMTAQWDW